jgi:hypothetical protein
VTLLADALVVLHLGFIAFVVLGGMLAARWPAAAWIHLPAASWGAFVELTGGVCPLTPIENSLRRAGGQPEYGGDFIGRYVTPIVYPAGLTPGAQAALGVLLVAVNAAIYAWVWRRHTR